MVRMYRIAAIAAPVTKQIFFLIVISPREQIFRDDEDANDEHRQLHAYSRLRGLT